MNIRALRAVSCSRLSLAVLGGALALAAGCTKSNPAQPTGSGTASVTTPKPAQPADSTQIPNTNQPVTLVVQNALSTQSGTTYTFEVALDPSFSSKAQTKD